ncbi:MAG: TonB-dependent receptor [Polyangiaceae bacterium]|nr:TonB-dependent receptor [Polyangiaceae bacterium]
MQRFEPSIASIVLLVALGYAPAARAQAAESAAEPSNHPPASASAPQAPAEAKESGPAEPSAPLEAPSAAGKGESAQPSPPPEAAASAPAEEAPAEEADSDVDEADETVIEAPQDPARPPPKGQGVVWGVVTDTELHEPLIEAAVLVSGTSFQTITDLDGRYRLELPPGTYTLRFLYELHRPARLVKVVVRRGRVYRHDMILEPEEGAEDVIVVEAEVEQSSVEGQMLNRQRSTAVADSVGRTEIAKSADSNAAQAAQRVVGASVEGGRFVYVRGLGERYTNGLLNGAPLPSPEPDRAAVPLDLFPSQVLESVSINKTFTPDMPADFAGGSVNVQTREIPSKPLFSASAAVGYDTAATFRDRPSHRGSSTDGLGFDSGMRALPREVPSDTLVDEGQTRPDGTPITDEDTIRIGRAMNTYMSPTQSFTPPNHSFGVVAGQGWQIGHESRLGAIASLNYGRSFERQKGVERVYQLNASGELTKFVDYHFDSGTDKVRWGAMGSLTYELSASHQLKLIGLHSQLSDNGAESYEGFNAYHSADYHNDRLVFTSKALDFGELSGRHRFDVLNRGTFDWNAALSSARRNEPNTRDVVYQWNTVREAWSYIDASDSGRHFFAKQSEVAKGGGLNWTQPLTRGEPESRVKLGTAALLKNREFRARRFAFRQNARAARDPDFYCEGREFDPACSDKLFVPSNIGSILHFVEGTEPTDAYDAALDVYSAYAMGDVALSRTVRLMAGGRLEVTRQSVDPMDQLRLAQQVEGTEAVRGADLKDSTWLPAVSLVYSATPKSKLRVAASQTLARPQLRELAPFAFSNYFGGRVEAGNPDLTLSHITNLDTRFEYFPTLGEVLATTVFFKYIKDPIERVIVPGDPGTLTYRNSPHATLIGVELEARRKLDLLDEALRDFTVIANLTLSRSRVGVEQTGSDVTGLGFMTSVSRPMMLHAPWVLNLALDYANQKLGFGARVLYNVTGPRIVDIGTLGVPDEYIQPSHSIDLALTQDLTERLKAKLTVEDLLNTDMVVTVGSKRSGEVARRVSEGTVFVLGVGYTY